ncbi:MAG: winged helix-turn-helix transcriptional regulator [Candidatus Cloacimonetes bacterium]|nr:winged helix-turn-helix transcriptional regulator [Candidatus Cloacimonadota bacterium]
METLKKMDEKVIENQNIEFKESWHDEYLKTICGFANASGGCLEIVRNDEGMIIGLAESKKLMEDIPNKIKNAMAIIAEISLQNKNSKEYISINVNAYPFPISYRGIYYIRSGSTTQELTGNALDEFILRKQGKTWDGVPMPYVKVDDLERDALRYFRKKALESQRLSKEDLDIDDATLIQNLTLTENNYLKRAAILLFHQNPEYWVTGAYIKIGFFQTGADLIYQDEIRGPLISMPDRALDTIYTKYLKGIIRYEGIQRIDSYIVARSALREALLNAVVHKDYNTGVPIQIKVFPDKVIVFNTGGLPESWTVDTLLSPHSSVQRNPFIAEVFFRSGMIEAWGRGIEKIMIACKEYDNPLPVFSSNRSGTDITFNSIPLSNNGEIIGANIGEIYSANNGEIIGANDLNEKYPVKYPIKYPINETKNGIINAISKNPEITIEQLATEIGISIPGIKKNINQLKKLGIIERKGGNKNGQWILSNNEHLLDTQKYPVKYPIKYPIKYPVNDTQNKIINILIKNPEITLEQLASEVGMSIPGVKKNINQLKKLDIIERKGSDKTGYWETKV